MKKQAVIIGLFMLLFIIGCEKPTDNNDIIVYSEEGPMPLVVGNEWVYERGTRNSYLDSWTYDTVSFGIIKDTIISGHQWFGVANDDGYQYWTNREDGLWARSSAVKDPYMFLKCPWDGNDEWPGEDSLYNIAAMYGLQQYAVLPPMGVFWCLMYEIGDWPVQNDHIGYSFCPDFGIARKEIWHLEDVGFCHYRLRLIDCHLNPPPVDTSGSISLYLYFNRDSLPDCADFRVSFEIETIKHYHNRSGLYHFEQPENPSNVVESHQSIIDVSYEPDSLQYTHFIRLPYILPGTDSLRIRLGTPECSSDFGRTIVIDPVSVTAEEDTFLGRIDVF